MRLFLLPVSTRRSLIYCERIRESTSAAPGSKPPLSTRVITKANETWLEWERAKGGWKKTITGWGNSLLRRIPYEEYGLKSLPPGTNARLAQIDAGELRLKCLYPAAFVRAGDGSRSSKDTKSTVTGVLQKLAEERQSLHKNRLIYCLIGMPVSAPFMIVPVVPNLPFYYLCYRAYCHYRAWYGSKTLTHMLQKNAIDLTSSERLDQFYAAGLAKSADETVANVPALAAEEVEQAAVKIDEEVAAGKEALLLRRWNGDLLAEEFKLPEMEMEIDRAVEQVQKALLQDKPVQEASTDIKHEK